MSGRWWCSVPSIRRAASAMCTWCIRRAASWAAMQLTLQVDVRSRRPMPCSPHPRPPASIAPVRIRAPRSPSTSRVDDGALEWLPQETIVFDGARARSTTQVELAGDARFLGWEIACLGRPANGEGFASRRAAPGFPAVPGRPAAAAGPPAPLRWFPGAGRTVGPCRLPGHGHTADVSGTRAGPGHAAANWPSADAPCHVRGR